MVTLSYDDGLLSNYNLALPLHEKYGIPATFNIVGQRAIEPSFYDRFFNEQMVLDAHNRGIEIASHSYYHDAPLTDKTDSDVRFEMSESKRVLQNIINDTVETIAIPFSFYDSRIRAIASEYYSGARVYSELQNNIPPEDLFWLKSAIAITNTTKYSDVKAKIDEAIRDKKWCIIMFHGINPDIQSQTMYETTPDILESILQYISSKSRDILLPINTKDAVRILK